MTKQERLRQLVERLPEQFHDDAIRLLQGLLESAAPAQEHSDIAEPS